MADPRFFDRAGPFSLEFLAEISGAEIKNSSNLSGELIGVEPLSKAGPEHVSFIDNRRYLADFLTTAAGAILTPPDLVDQAPGGSALLVTKDPYKSYALIAQAYYPPADPDGVTSSGATIAPTAHIGAEATIAQGVVVSENAVLGDSCEIGPNSVIGAGVEIGDNCRIGANVSLHCCLIGAGVTIHAGVCIGQDGFGFAPGFPTHEKVPQLGRVIIGNDVEIGANTTIDRGSGPDTVIGDGTKIDNLVQIGHNVIIGKGCLIVSQAGISGSCTIGDFVMIGGQVGIAGHLEVGDGAKIAAKSGVTKDIDAGETVAGFPAIKSRDHWRKLVMIDRIIKGK